MVTRYRIKTQQLDWFVTDFLVQEKKWLRWKSIYRTDNYLEAEMLLLRLKQDNE